MCTYIVHFKCLWCVYLFAVYNCEVNVNDLLLCENVCKCLMFLWSWPTMYHKLRDLSIPLVTDSFPQPCGKLIKTCGKTCGKLYTPISSILTLSNTSSIRVSIIHWEVSRMTCNSPLTSYRYIPTFRVLNSHIGALLMHLVLQGWQNTSSDVW